jgi:hypothetical protein
MVWVTGAPPLLLELLPPLLLLLLELLLLELLLLELLLPLLLLELLPLELLLLALTVSSLPLLPPPQATSKTLALMLKASVRTKARFKR